MPTTSGDPEAGFTLLEVLTAFAIVAALMSAILTLYAETGRTVARAEATAATVEAARSALARIGADLPLDAPGPGWMDGPITITVASQPADQPGLWSMTAMARWDGAETRLNSLKFAPDAQR